MAQRDLSTFRTVTNVVAKKPNSLLVATVQIANQIVEQGQRSKMAESASQAQLEVSALQDQYRIDFQSDPMGGMEKYKNDRQKIFDTHFKGISPFFRRDWQAATRDIGTRNDAVQQAWALKQTRDNTIRSVNTSIKNALSQADNDGGAYGLSDDKLIDFGVNFATNIENIRKSAEGLLGEEDLNEMLAPVLQDMAKMFLSGTSGTNPVKALQALNSEIFAESFSDPEQQRKMTKAIEARALQFGKIKTETEVLNILSDSNSLLARSAQGEKMNYAVLLAAIQDMSPAAQDFFMTQNGYSIKGIKLSPSEKLKNRVDLYGDLAATGRKEKATSEDVDKIIGRVYENMNNKSLTIKEGNLWLNDLFEPMLEKRREELKDFTTGNKWYKPWPDNIGFDQLEDMLERINIQPFEDEELGPISTLSNNQNTDAAYSVFLSALQSEAQNKGMRSGDLTKLPTLEQTKIYGKAARVAASNLLFQKTGSPPPEGATFSDIVSSLENASLAAQRTVSQKVVADAYVTRQVIDSSILSVKPETLPIDFSALSIKEVKALDPRQLSPEDVERAIKILDEDEAK